MKATYRAKGQTTEELSGQERDNVGNRNLSKEGRLDRESRLKAEGKCPWWRRYRCDCIEKWLNATVKCRHHTVEPPDADPHVRWCGRGVAARLPPIPMGIYSPSSVEKSAGAMV